VTARGRRKCWDPGVGKVGNQDALNGEKFRGSIHTKECRPAVWQKYHRLAYKAGEIVKARKRDTNPKKALKERKVNVGAWCWIGGGQGALSQA